MPIALILLAAFVLKFGLLMGWMDDGALAAVVTIGDWVAGFVIYRWIRHQPDILRYIPDEVDYPSDDSASGPPSQLAA